MHIQYYHNIVFALNLATRWGISVGSAPFLGRCYFYDTQLYENTQEIHIFITKLMSLHSSTFIHR